MLKHRWALAAITAVGMTLPAVAASDLNSGNATHATMVIGHTAVMTLVPVGSYSAFDRVTEVQRRLIRFLAVERPDAFSAAPGGVEAYDPDRDLQISWHPGAPILTYKGQPLVTITEPDAVAQHLSRDALATKVLGRLRAALAEAAPPLAPSLRQALQQIAVLTDERSYSASEQLLDEGS